MQLSLCLLALGSWMFADTASVQTSILQGFKGPELACFAQRKLYYPKDKKCHDIPDHSGGNCTAGEWLVLDSERQNFTDRFEPRCKKKMCSKPLETFWAANRTCVKVTGWMTVCPQGNELTDDKYGEGICKCRNFPPYLPLSLSENAAPCFELYTRGPCPAGKILQAEHIKNKGRIAVCRPDPCADKSSRNRQYAVYSKDNKCYPLKEERPCPKPLTFQVSQRTLVPDCEGETFSIFALPPRCSHDQAGDCKKEIILAEEDKEAEAFNLIMGGRRKRKRSSPSPKR